MSADTHELRFDGAVLARGFWLYVWEIGTPGGAMLYYVGRTGDSSSANAQSPFNRMGQHLGFNEHGNVLRRHLTGRGLEPERCSFRLVAHGPIFTETDDGPGHVAYRDLTAAFEKALADAMARAGYAVINTVACKKQLDKSAFAKVKSAFAEHFPKLADIK